MKKAMLTLAPVLFVILAFVVILSSCGIEQYEKYFGHAVIHNDSGSGGTITRIRILTEGTTKNNERVSIPPGGKSNSYALEITDWYDTIQNTFNIAVTVDGREKTATVKAYTDVINNLYYDGTDLVER